MYTLTITEYTDEEEKTIIMYGIAYEQMRFDSLSSDKDKVLKLCERCNLLNLSPVHFAHVVEDFINETAYGIHEAKDR